MVTVFTPAYNCKKTIGRLYDSLVLQACGELEWVIVNDGSSDGSDELLERYAKDAPFPVTYVKTENGGKYNAYNKGLSLATGEYFICVDADDYLPPYAIQKILSISEDICDLNDCCGIVALKEILGEDKNKIPQFPIDGEVLTLDKIEYEYKTAGEKTYVFKTELVRDITFPDILPEKFFPELYLYDEIGARYKFITSNTVLTICEYQPDGYTGNYRKLMLTNPTGFAYLYGMRAVRADGFSKKLSMAARYNAFKMMSKNKAPHIRLGIIKILAFPMGLALIVRYKFL